MPKRASLQQENSFAKRFRTLLGEALKQDRINLAGHYILKQWGCGSSCVQVGVVDTKTGKTIVFPSLTSMGDEPNDEAVATRTNSRLVIYHAIPNTDHASPRAFHYYKFKDGQLSLLCRKAVALIDPFAR